MKHSRDVLRVVVHAEPLLDPLADQRASPDARLESGCLRTCFDDAYELTALLLRQSWRSPWKRARTQARGTFGVVPGDPFCDRRTIDLQLGCHRDGRTSVDVPEHTLGAPPHREILQDGRLAQQLSQPIKLTRRQTRWTNSLSIQCSSHATATKHTRQGMEREMRTPLREPV
jgi:hypothetical protein